MLLRLTFFSLLLITSGCVFISEPDIGASDHFGFEPEESSAEEPHRSTGNDIDSDSSTLAPDDPSDAGVDCEDEDSDTCEEFGDAGSSPNAHDSSDGSRDGLTPQPQDWGPADSVDDKTNDEDEEGEGEDEDSEMEEMDEVLDLL